MGREVRMVPKNWEHPKDEHGDYVPLYEGSHDEDAAEWDAEAKKWSEGLRKHWSDGWVPIDSDYSDMTYEEYAGPRPKASSYMGNFEGGTATHLMMYEDTSEGTPISPAFETPEELAKWLADTGASSFGSMTATYEQWLRICRGGFAPSMVITGGAIRSGVEAMYEIDDD